MESYLLEFCNLLLRWLHVIAAIAWIGESIYFVMLDNSLTSPQGIQDQRYDLLGEMSSVHGGGFYHNQKYLSRPPFPLDDKLHWSFWKSYTTWLSGFFLFCLLYLSNASIYLVNPASPWAWAAVLTPTEASIAAVALLIFGWLIYDELCRRISPEMQRDGILSVAVALMMTGVAYFSSHVFQGRAAFLLTGAVMATCMSANVFFWIIPGQRRMVAALQAEESPNPLDGKRGKQRSVHNTYFTLPVVFLMISNHYAFAYSNETAWFIMTLFILAGALIRQYFVLRHRGHNVLTLPAASGILLLVIAMIAAPSSTPAAQEEQKPTTGSISSTMPTSNDMRAVTNILHERCTTCHAAKPTQAGFTAPPAGIRLDNDLDIRLHHIKIKQAVASKYMPLANLTKMSDEERLLISQWHP
ncbi:urate hydroxylase PuuD [Aquitalea sp.]|uniref:urate hydroxylase PuuD n=1 Tax=Aquitalea sp. TaxID=1872623 RepID=UPI00258FA615|nr:urate hydroxylase PuuD [Aquitalea sp.]